MDEQKPKRRLEDMSVDETHTDDKHRRLEDDVQQTETGPNPACLHFLSSSARAVSKDECAGEPAVFPDQQSTEAPETSNENTQWLVLDELVSHDLPESSPPGSPRPYLKSESKEPVAEAGQVPAAAELAELAAFREEAEEYDLRRMHALLAEKEPVTDRPFAVEHSARLHTHRYRLRPSWPRLRSSMAVEQLADACVVLEELHQKFRDSNWLWGQIPGDIHKQTEALRDAYARHYTRTYAAQGLARQIG